VPPGLEAGAATPLVLVLHGGGGSGVSGTHQGPWDHAAREHGFVSVAPDAVNGFWGSGGSWDTRGIDDVAFLVALLDVVADDPADGVAIDPSRVYLTGFSNGGTMAYRLAAEVGDRFAAVAPVGAVVLRDDPPRYPISVLHVHGRLDGSIPYDGGTPDRTALDPPPSYRSVRDGLMLYVRANGCDPTPEVHEDGALRTERWTGGRDDTVVELITIADGGHAWPGGRRLRDDLDEPSDALDATATIWRFFAPHTRRPS
jgi:polyhydroxybutyrate depolymerase